MAASAAIGSEQSVTRRFGGPRVMVPSEDTRTGKPRVWKDTERHRRHQRVEELRWVPQRDFGPYSPAL